MHRPTSSVPAVLAVVALCVSGLVVGCAAPDRTVPPPSESVYSLDATPWPNGTVGQYGLRIDPALLKKLPATAGGLPVIESVDAESSALDNADLAKSFDTYAAGGVGAIGDANWLNVTIGHLRPEAQVQDWYQSWTSDYAAGACSQADGVTNTVSQTIADWPVEVSTCGGGVVVYSLQLDADYVLSMYDLGPRHLGRQLIESLP